jgi:hypothetical protein
MQEKLRQAFRQFRGFFAKFIGQTSSSPEPLLPSRKPLLAELRPGRQHCQIHDADYLEQILSAELESAEEESANPTNKP